MKIPFVKSHVKYVLPAIWVNWIRNRVKKLDYNYTQVNTGDTGTGKTKCAVILARLVDPTFNEAQYTNNAKEFLDIVEDVKKGSAVVWDEAGVGLGARQWYSLSNILTGQALQTYRERNLAVFFCTPDLGFIDVQARKLINGYVEMKRSTNNCATAWLYNITIDRKHGKVLYPWFQFKYLGMAHSLPRFVVERNAFKIVPKDIWKAIQHKDTSFKNKILARAKQQAEYIEAERFGSEETIFDLINKIQEDPERESKFKFKGKWDTNRLMTNLKLSERRATQVRKELFIGDQLLKENSPSGKVATK